MTNAKKKTVALIATCALLGGITNFNYKQNYVTNAACSRQNIFTETLEEDTLEDNNRWVLSKADSTAISIKNVGRNTLCLTPGTVAGTLQYDEKITLGQKQYVEMSFTFENMPASAVIDFTFSANKATDEETELNSGKEGVSLYADPSWLRGVLNSDNAQTLYGGWGNYGPAGSMLGLQWTNGNALYGAPNVANGKYKMKARYYDDGSAIFYTANPYSDNYFPTAMVGFNPSTFEDVQGFQALSEGYLQLMIRNAAEAYIGEAEVAVYNYEKKGEAGVGVSDGVMVEGSKYTETIEENVTRRFNPFGGNVTIKAATKAILVDNAADDDFIVKKTKLSKPENNYAEKIYNLSAKFIIPQLEGAAKAVIYLGGETQSDFSAATKLEFSKTAFGVVKLTVGTTTADTEIKTGEIFDLLVTCGGDYVNRIYINGKAVPVTASKNLSFEKDLSDKFIAFGTTGVSAADKASIALASADFKKFNYQQGTGGDFTETFDGGKYNKANIAFGYRVENIQDFYYADVQNGSLVIDNVGYTGVVSSQQSYGDFEFTFEISELMMNRTETGEELPANFMISWGRPAAEADYAAGGCGLYLVHGSDLNIMGEANYAAGYGAWFALNLPTDKVDEAGNPLEKAATIWDYDFSQGNLVFKTVKKDTTVKVYLYTADSAADDSSRSVPICVLENDYSAAGMVGICGVPTGKNMCMKIDSFSVKNTDEHKLDNLVTGTESDVVNLDLTPDEPDEPITDPFENENKNPAATEEESKGCGGAVSGVTVISAAAIAAVAVGKKRKKEEK